MANKKLHFNRIYAKNFRSIDNSGMELLYNDNPTTLVASFENGAGKSTLLVHALYYGLFDKAYRDGDKKTSLINSRSGKDCLVEVDFEARGKKVTVRRGMKPSVFDILEDGVRVTDEAALKDYQGYLLSIINMDEKVFCNTVALGKDRFVPFINMTAGDRRGYVEQMLDLVVFSEMNKLGKEDLKAAKLVLDDLNYKLTNLETKISGGQRLVDVIQGQIDKRSGEVDTQIAAIRPDLDKATSMLTAIGTKLLTKKDELAASTATLTAAQNLEISTRKTAQQEAHLLRVTGINSKHNQRKEEHSASLETLRTEIAIVEDKFTDLPRYQTAKTQADTKISGLRGTVNKFRSMDVCPTCSQSLSDDVKSGLLGDTEHQLCKLEAGVNGLVHTIQEKTAFAEQAAALRTKLTEQDRAGLATIAELNAADLAAINQTKADELAAINQLEMIAAQDLNALRTEGMVEINRLDSAQRELTAKVNGWQAQIRQLETLRGSGEEEAQLAKAKAELEGVLQEHVTQKAEHVVVSKTIENLNGALYALKDDGVKSEIVKLYVPFLNEQTNKYLDALNLWVNLRIDEEFNVEMFAPERKGQTISSLSTGQVCRIDLSILLAWREIATKKASVDCNILILDETLENLSEQGAKDFIEMWRGMNPDGEVKLFVISQRATEFEEYFDNTIVYALKDDTTVQVR